MQTRTSRCAGWRRHLLTAALLPSLGGCMAATQVSHHTAMGLAMARGASVEAPDPTEDPFPGVATLERERLIDEVLRRNPGVESARQAWREALARYPQVTAFADPTLSYEAAPGTLASEHGYGQVIRLNQRFEWPGKQALRGAVVLAEAEARGEVLERVRLRLRTTASVLYDDYFVVRRALEINRVHQALVTALRRSAEAQYGAGRGSQQDPIQADVELALLQRERLALVARGQVIVARLNGLLHRPATSPLPAAPPSLDAATMPSLSATQWLQRAHERRPDLRAASRIVDARRSGVTLAEHAYYPDFSIGAAYNSMWPQIEHQFMFRFSLNIPLQLDSRRAGVEQASAALARAQSRHAEREDAVGVEVRKSLVEFEETIAEVAVYRDQILPATRRQVEAAEAGYMSGRNSFSDIMNAQRRLRSFELEYAQALANTWRHRASLSGAVGTARLQQTTEGGAP